MKTKFEIKQWLGDNRSIVTEKYEALTKEVFFQGQDLRTFMYAVLNAMVMNNVKSEKRALSMLPFLMGNVYFEFSNPSAHLKK